MRLTFHFFWKKTAYFRKSLIGVSDISVQIGPRINKDIIGNKSFYLRDRLIIAHCPALLLNTSRASALVFYGCHQPVPCPDRASRQAGHMGNC
ncbi:MAG: hypothetical protein QM803_07470 [Rhodocyclaceae bacterium]